MARKKKVGVIPEIINPDEVTENKVLDDTAVTLPIESKIEAPVDNTKFEDAVKRVLNLEGGYSNNKFDKGGATKYGISLTFLKGCGIDKIDLDKDGITTEPIGDLNHDKHIDTKDILLLTQDMAKKLYKAYFYDPINIDEIENEKVGQQVFDIAVNSGIGTAKKLVEQVLKAKYSTAEINKAGDNFNNRLVMVRKTFLHNIVLVNPKQECFLYGWTRRADSFLI